MMLAGWRSDDMLSRYAASKFFSGEPAECRLALMTS